MPRDRWMCTWRFGRGGTHRWDVFADQGVEEVAESEVPRVGDVRHLRSCAPGGPLWKSGLFEELLYRPKGDRGVSEDLDPRTTHEFQ